MVNLTKIFIKKHIAEEKNVLRSEIFARKQKMLLVSPMKSGKTTFVIDFLHKELSSWGVQLVFVSPMTTLIKDVQARAKHCITCYNGNSCKLNSNLDMVITTPDSFYKVVEACKEENRQFYVVYDEAHEIIRSYDFRKKMIIPLNYYDNELCYGFMGMTATPEIFEGYENNGEPIFEKTFEFTPEEPFVQAEKTFLSYGLSKDVAGIVSWIINYRKKDKTPIVVRVNNKNIIAECENILSKLGYGVSKWYTGNEDIFDNTQLEDALNKLKINFDVLFTTCLIDVGVEIELDFKPVIVDFMDNNSKLIEDIQFVGRFRNGIKELHLFSPKLEEGAIQEKIKEKLIEYRGLSKALLEIKKKLPVDKDPFLKYQKVDDKIIPYDINEEYIQLKAFEEVMSNIIANPEEFKKYLSNHSTFNSKFIMILKYPKEFSVGIEEQLEELKELKACKREEFKFMLDDFKEKASAYNDKEVEILLTKEEDILQIDKWILEKIEESYNFYHSDDMKNFRKQVYTIKDIAQKTLIEAFRIVLAGEDKNIMEQYHYKLSNDLFDTERPKPSKATDIVFNKEYRNVYNIRTCILEQYGKERRVKVSNKLLKLLKEKKCFSKMSDRILLKHLNLIYVISLDDTISSLKK